MNDRRAEKTSRILSLDALRGIAALIVLFDHLQNSFLPHLLGGEGDHKTGVWYLVPLCFLLNGALSVALFFVLSGFVLTQRFFESGRILDIPDAILKRWPRLAGPVVIVSLLSGLMMGFGFYRNLSVSNLNHSYWLTQAFQWQPRGFEDVINAFNQGIAETFFTGVRDYNGAFWTMHYEFLGSLAVYALTLFVILIPKRLDWRFVLMFLLALWIREVVRFPFLGTFVIGTALSYCYTKSPPIIWEKKWLIFMGFAFCITLGGFTITQNDMPESFYAIVGGRENSSGRLILTYFLYSLISLFFLTTALWAPFVRDFLSTPLLRKLGHLSFPIYLIHTPIICSVGSWVYLAIFPHSVGGAVVCAILVSIVLTLVLSVPLAALDDQWLLIVRRITPLKSLLKLWNGRDGAKSVT